MYNYKLLNGKPNEIESVAIKVLVLYQIPSKQTNIDCEIAGYKEKCYLVSCEITLKGRFENHNHNFYNPNSKRCLLCLNEKYETATYNENIL